MIELPLIDLDKIEILRLIHLLLCTICATFLIFLWKRVVKIDNDQRSDIGLLLLAGAFIMWVFMDAYRFTGLMKPGESSLIIKTFSAYNNAFFIASLPFFSSSFQLWHRKIEFFQTKTRWALVVLISTILLVMVYAMVWKDEKSSGDIVNYIDLGYSVITYVLLGYALISRIYAEVELRFVMPIGILLAVGLLVVQIAFSPLFSITHYDLLSVLTLTCHFILAIILIAFGYEWLLFTSASMVSEKNKTKTLIQKAEEQNRVLLEELQLLKTQINNERSISKLSDRELDVLKLMELSYSEIGEKLFISRDTVITHKKNIEAKLGLNGKKELEDFAKRKHINE